MTTVRACAIFVIYGHSTNKLRTYVGGGGAETSRCVILYFNYMHIYMPVDL